MNAIDKIYRAVRLAADTAAIEAGNRGETQAEIVAAGAKAAIECALGNGILNAVNENEWPEWITVDPPYPFPVEGT